MKKALVAHKLNEKSILRRTCSQHIGFSFQTWSLHPAQQQPHSKRDLGSNYRVRSLHVSSALKLVSSGRSCVSCHQMHARLIPLTLCPWPKQWLTSGVCLQVLLSSCPLLLLLRAENEFLHRDLKKILIFIFLCTILGSNIVLFFFRLLRKNSAVSPLKK